MNSHQIQILALIAVILLFLFLLYRIIESFSDENNRVFVSFLVLIVVLVVLFFMATPLLRRCGQSWCQTLLFIIPK
jgi:uncharacterized membrane protein